MSRLRIRDVHDRLEETVKLVDKTNERIDQVRNAVYFLVVVQLGVVSHLVFTFLSR